MRAGAIGCAACASIAALLGSALFSRRSRGRIGNGRRCVGAAGDPRDRRELGGLARRRRLGALSHRLARRRPHDGDLVPGHRRRVHRRQPRRLREGRQHPALPRRQLHRPGRQPRHRPDQDDDLAARARARRAVRRRLHGPLLRFLREARRALGPGAAPADLREGPHGPGRPRRAADARPGTARPLPGRLPPPRLPADRRSASRSSPTCPASRGPRSRRSTRAGGPGSPANRSDLASSWRYDRARRNKSQRETPPPWSR